MGFFDRAICWIATDSAFNRLDLTDRTASKNFGCKTEETTKFTSLLAPRLQDPTGGLEEFSLPPTSGLVDLRSFGEIVQLWKPEA